MLPALAMPAFVKAVPRWAWIAIGSILLVLAFWLALNAYGNSRYREGKKDADAAWIAASNKLIAKAQKSGTKADVKAAARAADFAAKQEDEKEAIAAKLEAGESPLDALFGS